MRDRIEKRAFPRYSAALLLLIAFAIGCGKGEKEEAQEVAVQAAPAVRGDISRVVRAEAVLFPIAQSAITPKINAPVRKFYVTRGQKVRQGQLLATLENRDLSAAALDNKGAYEQAEAAYNTSVNATLPEETAKAELEVQTAQQELDAQQKLYGSRQDLFQQGALPRKDLDAAAVSLAQARSAYNLAKKHLEGLNAVGRQSAVKSAGGQLTSAKGKLLNSEAQLSYSEVRSPISGVITERPLYPGEMASTTAPLLTVMDISQIIAKAHLPQAEALLLHKGDAATLVIPGLEKSVPGRVSLVSPALDAGSTTVEIWIQTANPGGELRPGMAAEVSITAETVKGAVVVPASALIHAREDAAQVMVIDGKSQAQARDVKTGIHAAQQVQIISGLNAGEVVVTEGAFGLPDKARVRIEKPESAASGEEQPDTDAKSGANGPTNKKPSPEAATHQATGRKADGKQD